MQRTLPPSGRMSAGAAHPTSHPAHPSRGEAKAANAAARRLGALPNPSGRKAAVAAHPTSQQAHLSRGEAKAADAAARRLRA
jgi:hypothetical protein